MDPFDLYFEEDLGDRGDVTTEAVGVDAAGQAEILIREPAIVAGIEEVCKLFARVGVEPETRVHDGERVDAETVVATGRGEAADLLRVERLALNVLGRMSGVATRTRRTVEAARKANRDLVVAATRKTTPGFRPFEKRAVVLGGGDPHRHGLHDGILIKENHLAFVSVEDAVQRAERTGMRVQVEAETEQEAVDAAAAGADRVLLDNIPPERLAEVAGTLRDRFPDVVLEASGGITPENVERYAPPVDVVSLGSLTTRAEWVDFSMYVEPI